MPKHMGQPPNHPLGLVEEEREAAAGAGETKQFDEKFFRKEEI